MSDTLILCYHALSEDLTVSQAVSPATLRRQLELLVARGYRGATFAEAVLDPPGPRVLAVTFDDGYRSVLDLAAPILAALGLPGTLFVPTDFVGRPGPAPWWSAEHRSAFGSQLDLLGWSELGILAARGWEIGSHTRSHRHLTACDDATLDDELRGSREVCEERLGVPCRSIAYPFGDVDERVVAATARSGYQAAGAIPVRFREPRALEWPRVGIYHRDTRGWHFRLKVSPAVRRLRASPAWERYGRARRALSGR